MDREQYRQILLSEPGSQSAIARELGITPTVVHDWLRYKTTSARVEAAVLAKVEEIQSKQRSAVA